MVREIKYRIVTSVDSNKVVKAPPHIIILQDWIDDNELYVGATDGHIRFFNDITRYLFAWVLSESGLQVPNPLVNLLNVPDGHELGKGVDYCYSVYDK